MRQQITKCDLCGHEQVNDSKGFHTVTVHFLPHQYVFDCDYPKHSKDWCDSCCTKMNLIGVPKEKKEEMPEPTMDELIRQVVRQEIQHL